MSSGLRSQGHSGFGSAAIGGSEVENIKIVFRHAWCWGILDILKCVVAKQAAAASSTDLWP